MTKSKQDKSDKQPPKFEPTKRWDRCYAALSADIQKKVRKTLKFYAADPFHPGLGVERIKHTKDIWAMRVDANYRISFQQAGNTIILRAVGIHDRIYKSP